MSRKKIRRALKDVEAGDVVQVKWGDAWSHDGWGSADSAPDVPMACITVGHFIGLRKQGLLVAGSGNANEECASIWFIPIGWIEKLRVLA